MSTFNLAAPDAAPSSSEESVSNCFFHIIQQKTEERCQDAIQKVRKRRGKERRRKGDKISKWVHWCCCQNLKFPQTRGCLQIINQPRLWIWIQIIQPLHCFSFLPGVSWNSYSLANLLLRQIRNSSGSFFFILCTLSKGTWSRWSATAGDNNAKLCLLSQTPPLPILASPLFCLSAFCINHLLGHNLFMSTCARPDLWLTSREEQA